ncbi:hypothetical protein TYRP_001521 [Tyrophagus putrescentiae]|nr:hypothetical protein TYRP_001521 [Tyrophagus putrescentiae]
MTTPNPYPNPNSYHIDRFDSLSTCNTDHLSLFDELQSRRQSSNNQSHFTPLDPVTEMEPPPPPPPPPSSNSTFYHHPSSNNSQQTPNKQPLHLQISNTSTTSQTSDICARLGAHHHQWRGEATVISEWRRRVRAAQPSKSFQ